MNKLIAILEQEQIQKDVRNDVLKYHSKEISLKELKTRIKQHGDRFAESIEAEDNTKKNIKEDVARLLDQYLNCDIPTLKIMLDLNSNASIIYFFDPEDIPEETFLN